MLYGLSDLLFVFGYHILRYRRDVTRRNLRNAFPEKTEKEIIVIERKFYHILCDYPIEGLKLLTMSVPELEKRMTIKNPEGILKYMQENKAMMFMLAHQFNWEWMVGSLSILTKLKIFYVYQEQSSKFFDDMTHRIRMRFGPGPIKRNSVAKEVIRKKGTLHGLALLADQFPGFWQDKRYWTTFLNQETAFFQGGDQIAAAMQYPVFFFIIRRLKRGYYELEIVQIAEPPYKKGEINVVNQYALMLEKSIREQPENWLWSHDRWKRSKKDMNE